MIRDESALHPRSGLRGQETQYFKTNGTGILPKLPAYGKTLIYRQNFNNLPFLVVVCAGATAWQDAKDWQKSPSDICALVLCPDQLPKQLKWPVSGCMCLIEWSPGPGEKIIIDLVGALLISDALLVTVRPLFVNTKKSAWQYDTSKPISNQWVQIREEIQSYYQPQKEAKDAA